MKETKNLEILIDTKKPIARYFEWDLFLNPLVKPDTYGRAHGLFVAKRMLNGKVLGMEVKGETIIAVRKKIDNERKSSEKFRNKCKTLLTDIKKCDYCVDRFLCFTEK